jgi:glycosyltransferase involved in cell wall biosynthesis
LSRATSSKPDRECLAREPHQTLAFAGGGVEIKGALVLLGALPELLEADHRLRVLVAGGGEEQILDRFRQHEPRVRVLGRLPISHMKSLFASSDLTLVPSVWHENSPMVIGESYEAGTPVVGSDVGGIPELVHHGRTGYLFANGDSSALAATVNAHFHRTATERRRMRHACYQEVRTRFTLARHIQELMSIYGEVL